MENDLIRRSDVIKAFQRKEKSWNEAVRRVVNEIPARVCFCGNCSHRRKADGWCSVWARYINDESYIDPEHFYCAEGEDTWND